MVSSINLSQKAETVLVEVSAGLIAAGTAGMTAVSSMPVQYQALGASVCGGLITIGGSMIAVWHKFVNVFQAQVTSQTQSPTITTPTSAT